MDKTWSGNFKLLQDFQWVKRILQVQVLTPATRVMTIGPTHFSTNGYRDSWKTRRPNPETCTIMIFIMQPSYRTLYEMKCISCSSVCISETGNNADALKIWKLNLDHCASASKVHLSTKECKLLENSYVPEIDSTSPTSTVE